MIRLVNQDGDLCVFRKEEFRGYRTFRIGPESSDVIPDLHSKYEQEALRLRVDYGSGMIFLVVGEPFVKAAIEAIEAGLTKEPTDDR